MTAVMTSDEEFELKLMRHRPAPRGDETEVYHLELPRCQAIAVARVFFQSDGCTSVHQSTLDRLSSEELAFVIAPGKLTCDASRRSMSFPEAMTCLMGSDRRAMRAGWSGTGLVVFVQGDHLVRARGAGVHCGASASASPAPWTPQQADLFAHDWSVT